MSKSGDGMRTWLRRVRYSLILGLLNGIFLFQPVSMAAMERPQFYHLTVNEGLSHSAVKVVLQDHKGFIWIGTKDGLNRYDGYQFIVYRHEPGQVTSLSSQFITALHEDRWGNLWIGTLQGGLNKLEQRTGLIIPYLHSLGNENSLGADSVMALQEDSQGNLWIGTTHGVSVLNPDTGVFTQYRHQEQVADSLSNDQVNALLRDDMGRMWVGTGDGLNCFDANLQRFTRFPVKGEEPYAVHVLAKGQDGRILVGTNRGVEVIQPYSKTLEPLAYPRNLLREQEITALWPDAKGGVWLGTYDGLGYLDQWGVFQIYQQAASDPRGLNSDKIQSLYTDSAGRLWVGTLGGGVNVLDQYRYKFSLIQHKNGEKNSLINNMVLGFRENEDGNLWIATEGGMDRWGKNSGEFVHYVHDNDNPFTIPANSVFGVYLDRKGRIWAETLEGISYYDKINDRFVRYRVPQELEERVDSKELRCVYEDREGNLWLGSDKGLIVVYAKDGRVQHYTSSPGMNGLSDNRVRWLYEDQQGFIWIGTLYGTSRLCIKTQTFTNYFNDPGKKDSIGSNIVFGLWEDEEEIWLGTHGGGLSRFLKATERFTSFTTKDGLPNDVVYGILPDEQGNLWLSTNKGLSFFDRKQGVFRNYDSKDGLQGREFNSGAFYKSRSGELFFGGANGFNRFFPQQILLNPVPPPVVITGVQVGKLNMPAISLANGKIIMSYEDRVVRFEFAALDYTAPEKNLYAYMLEGYDTEWNYGGNLRFAVYSRLEPGEYVFRVKGANRDGVWNEEGSHIFLVVEAPWWRSWWAYGFYALCVFSCFVGYIRYQMLNQQRKLAKAAEYHRILEEHVHIRTAELQQANEKLKYLSLHDSLTGLYNRRAFHKAKEQHNSAAFAPVSIIVCDLNGLKLVNDMLGHQYGDALIVAAGKVLESSFRANDMVARIGGDEFAVLLPSCGEGTLARACTRLREAIDAYNQGNGEFYLSMSIGTAVSSNDSVNMKELFIAADDAMYQEKFVCKLDVQAKILEHIRKIKEKKQYNKK